MIASTGSRAPQARWALPSAFQQAEVAAALAREHSELAALQAEVLKLEAAIAAKAPAKPTAPKPPVPAPRPVAPKPGAPAKLPDPASYFITQTRTQWNPGGSINANCGPTSLAMALKAFGKLPAQYQHNPEGFVEAVRRTMTGADNIHAGTYTTQVLAGARKLGLQAEHITSVTQLAQALSAGKLVVAQGNPAAYGKEAGGHFILVVGRTSSGGYVINDPAYTGRPAVAISAAQMAKYLGDGVAVSP